MEQASAEIEAQIATMEAESTAVLAQIRSSIGDLSDLRYGRFAKTPGAGEGIRKDVLTTLKRLASACDIAEDG
jgi:centromere-localized protein 2